MTALTDRLRDYFASQKILLIGDTILDVQTFVEPIKPAEGSPLTPNYCVVHEARSLGGAGLVYRNLVALGNLPTFYNDSVGWTGAGEPTTKKQRIWCDGKKILQLDTFGPGIEEPIWEEYLDEGISQADKVVVADYRHGLLTPERIADIVGYCQHFDKPLYVASQVSQSVSNHILYRSDKTIFVLNETEAGATGPLPEKHVVTLGARGCFFRSKLEGCSQMHYEMRGITVDCVDSTGAGDAFLAAFCLMSLDDPSLALRVANTWAGLSTKNIGADPPNPDEFWKMLEAW